ncbi:MAG: DUF2061 domain-containing protein [Candidatus Micrarchaeota archaeon]|nr:DUF2061 domain-containing protein [Candidatus Micrarchaeota archaeon]
MKPTYHFGDSWKRSILKTVTYRIAIIILDFVAVYLLTGKSDLAVGFVIVSNIYSSISYYIHERVWDRIKWGLVKSKS